MTPTAATDLIPPREAAALLGVHPRTLTRWARSGLLPFVKTLGGHRRYARAEIERLARFDGEAGAEEASL